MKLLKKEWILCMHPMGWITPVFSALILVPGYPYGVICFYMGLVIYFISLSARENHDATYTLTLPVSRADAVRARIRFCLCLEGIQLVSMGIFIPIKYLIGFIANPAGLDAGLALIGEGALIFTIFNAIFFPLYYRDINRPGFAFLLASGAVFVWIILEIVATYTVPFVRFVLDQPDPVGMRDKALFTLGALVLLVSATFLTERRSIRKFEAVDLSL